MKDLWRRAVRVAERCHDRGIPVEATLERRGTNSTGGLGSGVKLQVDTVLLVRVMETFLDHMDEKEANSEEPPFPVDGALEA